MSGIKKWVVPIMGFTENTQRASGIEMLCRAIRQFDGGEVAICDPWEWNEDSKANALWLMRNSSYLPTRILVVAYSWGAGWGFLNLARELQRLGQDIELAILCDPVFRSPINLLAPLSLTRFPRIEVPENVERVVVFRQRKNLPRAHDVVALGSKLETFIEPPITLEYIHQRIDNAPEFHRAAFVEIEKFCTGTNAPTSSIFSGGPVS